MDSNLEPESKLISLITQLMSLNGFSCTRFIPDSEIKPLITQIISLLSSIGLDSLQKPESKLMTLVTRTVSLFNSLDLDSQPKPLSELISHISQLVNTKDSESENTFKFSIMLYRTCLLEPEPDLMSLIHQIWSVVISMNSKWAKLISLAPQVRVQLNEGKFHVVEEVARWSNDKRQCHPLNWVKFGLRKGEEDITHFRCLSCNGENHEEYEKTPIEIKHLLHPKHSLQLVMYGGVERTRDCYCCDEDLNMVFYYCSVCDYALNIACVEKQRVLSIDRPKWHEHTLSFFPRQAPLTCDVCALTHSTCPFYICPHCGFVVHQSCLNLPRVIRISRHHHRISFTHYFEQGDWSCGVCRKRIDNDYGGYSCTKKGCSYGAHSKCATQSNVWDGKELEGEPEETEDKVEPFVRISDGVIQHFSHEHHHLRLDENKSRDYDENKLCHACITPIYFGNFYSCMQCEFILHETCANLSRKIHHPIHPHMLTLVERKDDVVNDRCTACFKMAVSGFFYECGESGCCFVLHVQCATISEPLVHGSHMHPLFLTSKPGERRICLVCRCSYTDETFNCIECDFVLCYRCATLPEKVRYKHDNHILTLSYGDHEETSTMMKWCEACERQIKPKKWFYKCDEYCCVTLHIECMLGVNSYMKPGSSAWVSIDEKVDVLHNNQHMSRPICFFCNKRCPYKIVFQYSGSVFCSLRCMMT